MQSHGYQGRARRCLRSRILNSRFRDRTGKSSIAARRLNPVAKWIAIVEKFVRSQRSLANNVAVKLVIHMILTFDSGEASP